VANLSAFGGALPIYPGGTVYTAEVSRTTNPSAITNNSFSTVPDVFASNLTFVADGSTYIVEFYCAGVSNTNISTTYFGLSNGSTTDLGTLGLVTISGANHNESAYFQRTYTPAAGSVSLNIRAYTDAGSTTLSCGANGAGSSGRPPMFLRVSKIVNQNDGLKPFWTPPVVTSLPSPATEGDQVLLYSSSPYAGYQPHQYTSGSWSALADSRGIGAWQSYTPTVTQSGTITCTTNYSKYIQIGKLVIWSFKVTYSSGTGTSGNALTLTLPVNAAGATHSLGSGMIYYNPTPRPYAGSWMNPTAGTIQLESDDTSNSYWGYVPSLAFSAANNFAVGNLTYEAA